MNFRFSLKKIFRFAATTGSLLTMVFSPVAHGLQSEKSLKTQVEAFVTETKLNKRPTYKEFWQSTKHLYSGQVYKEVESYFMQAPDALMPEVTLKESISTSGEKIPTLTISENGKSYNIQIFGEKEKFAKFNNVVLTENDLMLIEPAIKRITASDIKLKKEYDKNISAPIENKFSGTPQINREMWKKMSPMQRAQFVLNLRLLWTGARDVLEAKETQDLKKDEKQKSKKTSSLDKWNSFFAMLNNAEAKPGKKIKPSKKAEHDEGTSCVVAGYTGAYGKDTDGTISCLYPEGLKEKTESCPRPCSFLYGQEGPDKPFCVPSQNELQNATHEDGYCEKKMPLASIKLPFPQRNQLKQGSKRYEGIVEANKETALNAANRKDTLALTKKYLESMLSGELKDAFLKGELSDPLLKKLKDIQDKFNTDIVKARESCAADADKPQYDKKFEGACDQLHRRFLFVAEYLSEPPLGCPDKKPVDPDTLKCPSVVAVTTVPTTVGATTGGTKPPPEEPIVCSGDTKPSTDGKSCVCENGKPPKKGNKCEKGSKIKPWLIAAGVILTGGLLWLLLKGKKKDKPVTPDQPKTCQNVCAANTTQNPVTCSCDPIVVPPICTAPKVVTGTSCGCPTSNACTPGQQIYNLNTCQCDSVAQPGTCADGVTTYYTPPGPSSCPAPTLCQNGSQVYPPATCPPVSEGGSGDNCPTGDCNGGVPTGN